LDGREIIIKRLEKMLDVINKIQPFFGSKKWKFWFYVALIAEFT
jgi:hypothetical protein